MPGKQARVLCPVCQEPIPPDETECQNCGAFVIDEAVVRLSRALGLDREKALKLFDAGFRHPKQLQDRDPNRILEKGEVGLLFICTNCGGFVAGGDMKCPRCAAEFETEEEATAPEEEDILDLVLCPVCGADNDPELAECEICGEALKEGKGTEEVAVQTSPVAVRSPETPPVKGTLEDVDLFVEETEPRIAASPELPKPEPARPPVAPPVKKPAPVPIPKPTAPPLRTEPEPQPSTRPPTATPKALAPVRRRTTLTVHGPRAPVVAPPISAPAAAPATRPRISRAAPLLQKKIRRAPPPPPGTSPEMVGGLVLAGAAGLLLSGVLGQRPVNAGIAAFLTGLAAYVSAGLLRRHTPRPPILDTALLAAGILLGLAAIVIRGAAAGSFVGTGLAIAGAIPFAWATWRLLRQPQRVLLAIGGAIPLVAQAVTTASDPTYPVTLPWLVGILASMPWPAALAAAEILRRRSTTVLRRQLVQAERNVQRNEYERSLTEFDRAIALARKDVPGAEIPWYGKGATLILLGRYEEALRAIDTALDINPRNEVAWVNKGNALTKLGRHLDALRCFNAAIKVNPTFEVAWNNKGNTLARLEKYEEALRCYERALEIDAGYRGAWMNMGFVLTKLGRFDEAASCADRALHLENRRRAEPA